jgi:hypothetical protein
MKITKEMLAGRQPQGPQDLINFAYIESMATQ